MKRQNHVIRLDSIDSYNRLYGLTTEHPLVTVIDLKAATRVVNHVDMDYGVYALFLKNGTNCTIKYGRQPYDYSEGTVVCFAPGEIISVDTDVDETAPDVTGLMFHPDLLYGTSLADKISSYTFFDYSQREAVHLSANERSLFIECLTHIADELSRPVDKHTAQIISAHIQLLLDYMTRFYERQFITRNKINSDILGKFENALRDYYDNRYENEGIPTVAYFADIVNLTPGYFGDLIKRTTGKTPQEIIALRIIDRAKQRLTQSSDDVSIIAYELGFQHPQHFTRMFRRLTGTTPTKFRKAL